MIQQAINEWFNLGETKAYFNIYLNGERLISMNCLSTFTSWIEKNKYDEVIVTPF